MPRDEMVDDCRTASRDALPRCTAVTRSGDREVVRDNEVESAEPAHFTVHQ